MRSTDAWQPSSAPPGPVAEPDRTAAPVQFTEIDPRNREPGKIAAWLTSRGFVLALNRYAQHVAVEAYGIRRRLTLPCVLFSVSADRQNLDARIHVSDRIQLD